MSYGTDGWALTNARRSYNDVESPPWVQDGERFSTIGMHPENIVGYHHYWVVARPLCSFKGSTSQDFSVADMLIAIGNPLSDTRILTSLVLFVGMLPGDMT